MFSAVFTLDTSLLSGRSAANIILSALLGGLVILADCLQPAVAAFWIITEYRVAILTERLEIYRHKYTKTFTNTFMTRYFTTKTEIWTERWKLQWDQGATTPTAAPTLTKTLVYESLDVELITYHLPPGAVPM